MNNIENIIIAIAAKLKCSGWGCDECNDYFYEKYGVRGCAASLAHRDDLIRFSDKILSLVNEKRSSTTICNLTEEDIINIFEEEMM